MFGKTHITVHPLGRFNGGGYQLGYSRIDQLGSEYFLVVKKVLRILLQDICRIVPNKSKQSFGVPNVISNFGVPKFNIKLLGVPS